MDVQECSNPPRSAAGFSLVEMMMAAVVLGIGILGLTLLQVMALRSRGTSLNRSTAVQVGERLLDQVEEEGRNSWLNLTDTTLTSPGYVPNLLYFPSGAQPNVTQYFDANGNVKASASGAMFTTLTTGTAVNIQGSVGSISDVTVTVTYQEASIAGSTSSHQVVLTRRVIHG